VHVLVVDRDQEVVELIRSALRRAGITSVAAHTAMSALEALATRRPLVIVLDTSGLDVLQPLRARGHEAALIILTACDDDAARARALEQGAMSYLIKPFSCRDLLAHVRTHLQLGHADELAPACLVEAPLATSMELVEDDQPVATTAASPALC
jgi:two-component system, OmpR family, response regulator